MLLRREQLRGKHRALHLISAHLVIFQRRDRVAIELHATRRCPARQGTAGLVAVTSRFAEQRVETAIENKRRGKCADVKVERETGGVHPDV